MAQKSTTKNKNRDKKAPRSVGNAYTDEFVKEKKAEFLALCPEHSAMLWSIAKKIGVAGGTLKNWMQKDPEFNDAFLAAEQEILDKIEDVAKSRAIGYEENVWYKGEIVGTDTKVSEKMAELILSTKRGYTRRSAVTDETEESRLKRIRQKSEDQTEEQLAQAFMDDIKE